jgi:hypothetical protein
MPAERDIDHCPKLGTVTTDSGANLQSRLEENERSMIQVHHPSWNLEAMPEGRFRPLDPNPISRDHRAGGWNDISDSNCEAGHLFGAGLCVEEIISPADRL